MDKIILCLTTYNRYDVLRQSLESLNKTNFPDNCQLLIKDDCSDDTRVKELLESYTFNIPTIFIFNEENLGCDANVLSCIEEGFNLTDDDFVFVLDSDAYYHPEWLNKNLELLKKEEKVGLAGTFNITKHEIIEDKGDYVIKKSIGGISVAINREIYARVPKEIEWDWKATRLCNELGYKILCTKESYSEHLGIVGTHANIHNNKIGGRTDNFIGDNDKVDEIRKEVKDKEIKEDFDLVNEEKKILFMHIPKNAGKSAEKIFFGDRKILNPHKKCLGILPFIENGDYDNYYKVAVVRNTFDRFNSIFNYYLSGGNKTTIDVILGRYLETIGVNLFIKSIPADKYKEQIRKYIKQVVQYDTGFSNHFNVLYNNCIWNIEPMLINQSDYTHIGDKQIVDKIIDFNELEAGLTEVKNKFGLGAEIEHVNKSSGNPIKLDEESISVIKEYYKKDIELFGFEYTPLKKKEKY